jgi:hypothetical protein
MQLYGCGENSDGCLGEPRSCSRRSVGEEHCCEHNNQGIDGQLGIGTRQLGLCTGNGNTDIAANDTGEDFAVYWQKMDTAGILGEGQRCEGVFCEGDHTFIVVRNNIA